MQKQAARKRTFEKLPKPDIYKSYRHGGVPTDKAMAAVPAICNYIAIT
jgi:hypothetical protein